LTKEEMKNCVWLKPELVAQIEFTEWTPDGHLRHAKFVGLREDKVAKEVVWEGQTITRYRDLLRKLDRYQSLEIKRYRLACTTTD
jgi:ATP-dependent DNA ligase